ncbi:PepSY domain protein [Gemmatirosa kalamazoonensis]|uniref:PepSY domain protein n=1 Tax=Gemmatirosa kalamazoonensis TaxID=861299 RepID=W0RG31_9BACT|nr:PepSY domain-containing protein [Gemmatirosa kalamazoonensis]AHG88353.1 PepSY domain protein [Gemmatirosa kalamazoonensis]
MRRAHRTLPIALAAALLAVGAQTAPAQPITGSAALKARAKIRGDSAKKIARAQVPNGKIRSAELEEENGKLIYSFDLKVPGKSGFEEVNVDAVTGAVVGREHETAAKEKAEAKAEKAERKAAKKTP